MEVKMIYMKRYMTDMPHIYVQVQFFVGLST